LGRSFFVLSSDYLENLLEEYIYLSKQTGISYSDFNSMPTFHRKFLIRKLIEINEIK